MKKAAPKGPGGRPEIPADQRMGTGTFRRTEAQAVKLDALGGGAWIRAQIDAAKLKK